MRCLVQFNRQIVLIDTLLCPSCVAGGRQTATSITWILFSLVSSTHSPDTVKMLLVNWKVNGCIAAETLVMSTHAHTHPHRAAESLTLSCCHHTLIAV